MLIYYCCRLRAAVASRAVEIEGGDAMLAVSAFECGAAIHRFGCVISHIFIVVLLPVRALGNRCATLLLYHVPSRETLAMLPVIVRFPASVILSPRPEYSRMSARISFSRLEISDAGDYLPGCALRSDRDHRRFTMAAISSVFCAIRPSIGARCCCSRRSSSL